MLLIKQTAKIQLFSKLAKLFSHGLISLPPLRAGEGGDVKMLFHIENQTHRQGVVSVVGGTD